MRNYDLSPLFRSTVGFDQLDEMFDAAFREAARDNSYPPYNIGKLNSNQYLISMAIAGFSEDDIDITVHQNVLYVKGRINKSEDKIEYLHRGIAQRAFEHRFRIAEHVEVNSAELKNGLLNIWLKREIPEEMKPRKIKIGETH